MLPLLLLLLLLPLLFSEYLPPKGGTGRAAIRCYFHSLPARLRTYFTNLIYLYMSFLKPAACGFLKYSVCLLEVLCRRKSPRKGPEEVCASSGKARCACMSDAMLRSTVHRSLPVAYLEGHLKGDDGEGFDGKLNCCKVDHNKRERKDT
ncbi:hypothetical protein F4825DRAFT_391116 [Nemania diffusa]|nr:hypothetical protein F4825DRAFT_391116 [Nemania diffusa]